MTKPGPDDVTMLVEWTREQIDEAWKTWDLPLRELYKDWRQSAVDALGGMGRMDTEDRLLAAGFAAEKVAWFILRSGYTGDFVRALRQLGEFQEGAWRATDLEWALEQSKKLNRRYKPIFKRLREQFTAFEFAAPDQAAWWCLLKSEPLAFKQPKKKKARKT